MQKPKRIPQDRPMIKYDVRAKLSRHVFACFLAYLIPQVLPWMLRLIPIDVGVINLFVLEPFVYGVSLPMLGLSFLATTFVTGPMTVRLSSFFLSLNRDSGHLPSVLSVCDCFGPGYWYLVRGMLLRSVITLVSTAIPLVIFAFLPGAWAIVEVSGIEVLQLSDWAFPFLLLSLGLNVYWSLSFSMVSYILADNPYTFAREALRQSRAMTKGRLWELLVLQLSFFGWYLLVSITLMIGAIYVYPYVEGTMAAYYLAFLDPMPWEQDAMSPYED